MQKLYTKASKSIERQRDQIKEDVQRIDARLAELSAQKTRLVRATASGTITEADPGEEMSRINDECIELEKAKTEKPA